MNYILHKRPGSRKGFLAAIVRAIFRRKFSSRGKKFYYAGALDQKGAVLFTPFQTGAKALSRSQAKQLRKTLARTDNSNIYHISKNGSNTREKNVID